jgi:hypothetical protein
VNRAVRREFETFRMTAMRKNEITNSAPKATQGPCGPGTVTT